MKIRNMIETVYFNNLGKKTKLSNYITKLLELYLFPEFNNGNRIIKKTKSIIWWLCVYFFVATSVSYELLSKEFVKQSKELIRSYGEVRYLNKHAKQIVYAECVDSLKKSAEQIRLDTYFKIGIIIPEDVPGNHIVAMKQFSEERGIPFSIFMKLVQQESGFDSAAINTTSGAFGYMQMMPTTFKYYYDMMCLQGGKTPLNNMMCGAEMLKQKFNYWYKRRGNKREAWRMTLACYAMGDKVPQEIGKVPGIVDGYVNNIMRNETF